MRIISDFGKALDTMSREVEEVPAAFFLVAGGIVLLLFILYFLVLPRVHLEAVKTERCRKLCIYGLILLYITGIFMVTLLTREPQDEYRTQFVLLNDLWRDDHVHLGRAAVRDLLNLAFFVPLGFLCAWSWRGKRVIPKAVLETLAFSLCVEISQLVGMFGTFDVDDLLFNTLGGLVGAVVLLGWRFAFSKKSVGRYFMRAALVLCALPVVFAAGALGTYHFLRVSGQEAVGVNISTAKNRMESRDKEAKSNAAAEYADDPDLIWYDGKAYRYNEDLVTILFMGIDQRSAVIEQREGVSGESGQADTIFLLVMNEKKNKMKVIGISRDTMTDIPTFDYRGNYLGESENHIGLAYAFGDGKETSCQYMVDAVSNLFYGIPINSYVALNMEAVIGINDAVGGVTVTVPEDLTAADRSLVKGATVTLKGRQALMFMKWRDTGVDFSNNQRMARQKQYMLSFMKQAIQALKNDVTLPVTLYQSLADEMVTDISIDQVTYLATQALSMQLDEGGIMMLKSDSVRGSVYDEVYVDDDALYELILNIFYTEEKMGSEKS